MKITPKKIRSLALVLEKHLEDFGCEAGDYPDFSILNRWIADFAREEMNKEAEELHHKATNMSEFIR